MSEKRKTMKNQTILPKTQRQSYSEPGLFSDALVSHVSTNPVISRIRKVTFERMGTGLCPKELEHIRRHLGNRHSIRYEISKFWS